jgi:hypothetical protein
MSAGRLASPDRRADSARRRIAALREAQLSGPQRGSGGTTAATRVLESESAMKKAVHKLNLNKQMIRVLAAPELTCAAGGWIRPPLTWSCPQPR